MGINAFEADTLELTGVAGQVKQRFYNLLRLEFVGWGCHHVGLIPENLCQVKTVMLQQVIVRLCCLLRIPKVELGWLWL